jgi:hypothetical protein
LAISRTIGFPSQSKIDDQQSPTNHQSKIKNQRSAGRSGRAAGRMLAIAAELDLVTRLLAVVTAVLPERPLWFDGAIAGRVSTFDRSSHVDLRWVESTPLHALAQGEGGSWMS